MSRWCVVIAKKFDWVPRPNAMRTSAQGQVLYLPLKVLEAGVRDGRLKRIPRPPGFKVDKAGRVVPCLRN